ncbi:hypothetical protein DPEC_G00116220 [Dallia pectoralis]|uniref:Uncharacterized protein n=1 Tax=Dallia pectoralis TaxID=75939 RepID=A0ACC2GUT5_DALPE|nr:hypothetical protein DPEC_G00116220 [Dallia pectoralis]
MELAPMVPPRLAQMPKWPDRQMRPLSISMVNLRPHRFSFYKEAKGVPQTETPSQLEQCQRISQSLLPAVFTGEELAFCTLHCLTSVVIYDPAMYNLQNILRNKRASMAVCRCNLQPAQLCVQSSSSPLVFVICAAGHQGSRPRAVLAR